MSQKTALVAGGTGIIGRRIVEYLAAAPGWTVIDLSRRARTAPNVRWIAVDLNDPADCTSKLGGLREVTHIFYAARHDHPEGQIDSVEINAAMLRNLVETIEPVAELQHVHAVHGTKYYGHHMEPVPLPLSEESPRAKYRNFYYEQEDFLRQHGRGKRWTFTTSRPQMLIDPAVDYARSTGLLIWVYALVRRELGLTLDYPGTPLGFQTYMQFSDTEMLARSIAWMAQEPRCAGQAFNIVNADNPCWSYLWPKFAAYFGMPAGGPCDIKLADYMADKEPVWQRVIKKMQLPPSRLDTIALWPYGDRHFRAPWNSEMTMAKARSYGFTESIISEEMFRRHFACYDAAGNT